MLEHEAREVEARMAERQPMRMTPEEFWAWQPRQDKLYELVDGLPVLPLKMMTGASRAHDRIVVNLIRELGTQLRSGPSQPTTDNLAVRIPRGNIRRPDVTIDCGIGDRRDMEVREPRAVFEVLSPSTMSFDRIRKIPEYQSIPTLAHTVLIDTESPRIDAWSRGLGEGWVQTKLDGLDARLEMPAVGCSLLLSDVFEGLDFD